MKNKYVEIINIKKSDLYNFNLYLASLNKKLGSLVGGTVIFFFGVYGLVNDGKESLVLNLLLCLLGLLNYLFVFVISKKILKSKINKLQLDDMEPIEVTLDDDGILYKFQNEKNNESKYYEPFKWSEVSRVVDTRDYLYFHMMDHNTVLLITKKDIKNSKFFDFVKEKTLPLKRYFSKK